MVRMLTYLPCLTLEGSNIFSDRFLLVYLFALKGIGVLWFSPNAPFSVTMYYVVGDFFHTTYLKP
ncbi:hypothetical protein ACN23B_03155 [Anabaena sp. FACHB-709]|uniref:Uncharacterized protein n=2 Tax=Nostocaceae TaxID=1162 RepID=A0A1Z4KRN9_ANAVA|nr:MULTISPECIES: hypothetical protein [Nostocaceae]MBD2172460.1 hypothetical protein [Anabaena cylindrica FACHB-318]BAY71607.1 hypothetical protein NIES23_44270 [Trichormus variabilis NIES-23]